MDIVIIIKYEWHAGKITVLNCRGATSTVYKCEQKGTGQPWAVKIINKKVMEI